MIDKSGKKRSRGNRCGERGKKRRGRKWGKKILQDGTRGGGGGDGVRRPRGEMTESNR